MSRERRSTDDEASRREGRDLEREQRQPYASEHEDYSGAGPAKPPEEQISPRQRGKTRRSRGERA